MNSASPLSLTKRTNTKTPLPDYCHAIFRVPYKEMMCQKDPAGPSPTNIPRACMHKQQRGNARDFLPFLELKRDPITDATPHNTKQGWFGDSLYREVEFTSNSPHGNCRPSWEDRNRGTLSWEERSVRGKWDRNRGKFLRRFLHCHRSSHPSCLPCHRSSRSSSRSCTRSHHPYRSHPSCRQSHPSYRRGRR